MCYCKSTELYNESDQENVYKLSDKNTKEFSKVENKRQKQNAFFAKSSTHYNNFINTIDSYLISMPFQIEKIDYRIIKENPLGFHQNYISKGIPCIIKNIANHWPAMKKWQDTNYLISKMGKNKLSVDITPDGYADSIKNKYFVQPLQLQMTFEDFTKLKKFNSEENEKKEFIAYVQKQNNNLNEEFNDLKNDISDDVNEFFSELFQKEPDVSNIWIGTKESVTSLHKDNYENVFMVLKGEKHFTLIPPVYYPFMQPNFYIDANWKVEKKENFEVNEIKKEDFFIEESEEKRDVPWISINPDLKGDQEDIGIDIKKYHLIIESGDGLYLPPLWYHQVSQHSFEDDYIIGVNHWYDMEFNANFALYDLLRNLVDLKVEDK